MRDVPNILYKYKPITDKDRESKGNCFTRDLLTKGDLYFASLDELNDPNEAIFDYHQELDIFISENDLKNDLYKNFVESREEIDGRIKLSVDGRTGALHVLRQINKFVPRGVLSLTSDPANSLMYDYYSGGHKGICIGFEWEQFGIVRKDTQSKVLPDRVIYRTTPPVIDVNNANNDMFSRIFFTKSMQYSHEKEWRIPFIRGIFPDIEKIRGAIREIIFGCAVSSSDREMVKSWVSDLSDIKFFEANLKPKSYDINLKEI